ncbi:hypothetical protein LB531_21405 [Mesorhizobium sp. CO1-1-2]|uniref:hypothetical protein n=1 Tax=Mesorhizobium sp. CO1-1-2 TaxID=2876635 RepID=UPI001CCB0A1F|nr:hypothetical protein [Mesorhizobium sp. CO1-1-2]MBZ9683218.1 hypothetical protein [Mesorhizobium sp. CO1-1-2]
MPKTSNIWNLRNIDINRLADFIWRFALILYGFKFIADIIGSILYIYTMSEPAMSDHKSAALGGSVAYFSTAISMLLQLLAARFAIEIGVRLLGKSPS